jgi:hypothetical protein
LFYFFLPILHRDRGGSCSIVNTSAPKLFPTFCKYLGSIASRLCISAICLFTA